MYYDDISEIDTNAACYTINSSTTIYSYHNNVRSSYSVLGSKWYKTGQTNYNSLPVNSICYSYNDIAKISTSAELTPIYAFCALLISIAILLGGFYLLFGRILKRGM